MGRKQGVDNAWVSAYIVSMNASKAAAVLGRLGGLSRSKAKQRAARENGRKGGRPRKSTKGPAAR